MHESPDLAFYADRQVNIDNKQNQLLCPLVHMHRVKIHYYTIYMYILYFLEFFLPLNCSRTGHLALAERNKLAVE